MWSHIIIIWYTKTPCVYIGLLKPATCSSRTCMPVVDSFNRTCNYGSKYSGSNIAGTMELPFCGLSVYYVERLLRRTCRDWSRESGESSSHGGGTVQLQPCGRSPQPPRGIWGMPPPPPGKILNFRPDSILRPGFWGPFLGFSAPFFYWPLF